MTGTPFRVLHVCVGNVCRSVLAEHLMRASAHSRGPAHLAVASAGVQAIPDRAMHPDIVAVLSARGIHPDGFRTSRFTPASLRDVDLVLTATRAERNLVVGADAAALRRTFTLNEFARLAPVAAATPDPPAPLPVRAPTSADLARLVVATALTLRGFLPPPDPSCDDILDPDPTPAGFARCAVTIATAVEAVLAALYGDRQVRVAQASPGYRSVHGATDRELHTSFPHQAGAIDVD